MFDSFVAVSDRDKQRALELVLQSRTFVRSEQLRAFLRYVCSMEIEGRGEQITEYRIAVEALGRPQDYTTTEDSAVRNRAHALRAKLEELYAKELPDAPIRIDCFKGTRLPLTGEDSAMPITDNVTYTRGAHIFKFGALREAERTQQARASNFSGQFDFSNDANDPLNTGFGYPDRVAAVFLRSDSFLSRPNFPQPETPAAAYAVPVMGNAGVKERERGAWINTLARAREYRSKGGPAGFAPDPRTGHETGDSRYLAIPFLDACLAMRLPAKGSNSQNLKPVDMSKAWLASFLSQTAMPASSYKGNPLEAVWLPNEQVAKIWIEYVKNGTVADVTPPLPPFDVRVTSRGSGGNEITWEAEADFESGIGGFFLMRAHPTPAPLPAMTPPPG